jgi:hypothetical protein
MALLFTQVLLVSIGRARTHRKLGAFGIGYGILIIFIGLSVGFAAPLHHIAVDDWDMDRAAGFLLGAWLDMMLFTGFFGAALACRRRPEIHKRLMVLATVALFLPGAVRLVIATVGPVVWIGVLACLSPVLVAMGYELRTRGRVHAAYLVGTPILLLRLAGQFVIEGFEPGLEVGRRVLTGLMGDAVQ